MKLWISIVLLMFATVGHAGKAEAGYYRGSKLLRLSESNSNADMNECKAYLAAVDDITETYHSWGMLDKSWCIPMGVGTVQLRKVAIKGLNEVPEQLHLDASSLAANIFHEAFPCD